MTTAQTNCGTIAREAEADAPICEPFMVEPVFVSWLAQAKIIGGLLYLAYYVDQPCDWTGEERIVKARLIMPVSAIMTERGKVDAALGEHGMRVLSRSA